MQNIHAYTEDGVNPAYISINTHDAEVHSISVRTHGEGTGVLLKNGLVAGKGVINLTEEQLLQLAGDIYAKFKE